MTTTIIDYEDADGILQFSPRDVVLNQVENARPLNPLVDFASKLTRYVQLAPRTGNTTTTTTATTETAATKDDAGALLKYDPAAAVLRQVGNSEMLSKLAEFASALHHYLNLAQPQQPAEAGATTETETETADPTVPRSNSSNSAQDDQRRPDAVPSSASVSHPGGQNQNSRSTTPSTVTSAASPAPSPTNNNNRISSGRRTRQGRNSNNNSSSRRRPPIQPDNVPSVTPQPAPPTTTVRPTAAAAASGSTNNNNSNGNTQNQQQQQQSTTTEPVLPDAVPSEVRPTAEAANANDEKEKNSILQAENNRNAAAPDAVRSEESTAALLPAEEHPAGRRNGKIVCYSLQETRPRNNNEENTTHPEAEPEAEEAAPVANTQDALEEARLLSSREEQEEIFGTTAPLPTGTSQEVNQESSSTTTDARDELPAAAASRRVSKRPHAGEETIEDDVFGFNHRHQRGGTNKLRRVSEELEAEPFQGMVQQNNDDDDHDNNISQPKSSTVATSPGTIANAKDDGNLEDLSDGSDDDSIPIAQLKQKTKLPPSNNNQSQSTTTTNASTNTNANTDTSTTTDATVQQQTAGALTIATWVQCDNCKKWRRLKGVVDEQALPTLWYCDMNESDPERAGCSAPEEEGHDIGELPSQGQQPGFPGQQQLQQSIANTGQQLLGRIGGISAPEPHGPSPSVLQRLQGLMPMPTTHVPHPGMLFAQQQSTYHNNRSRETNQFLADVLGGGNVGVGSGDPLQNSGPSMQGNALLASMVNSVSAAQSAAAAVEGHSGTKRENEITPDQPKSKKRRTKKEKKEKIKEEDLPKLPEAPKIEAPEGYKGTLKESTLQRSVGLTRAVLNKHIKELGLTAKFGVPVFSSNGGKISHLTFNSQWNILPYTEEQTFKFWLGEGRIRLSSATKVDPESNPDQPPFPVFWAQPSKGGAICHYVGHYRCVKFDTSQKVMLKEKRRQALLEFKLVEFKVEMAEKIWNIAEEEKKGEEGGATEQS